MSADWLWMSAGDLGGGIGAGEIDAEALCDVYLEAIAAHPQAARIYARTTPERARAEAAAAAARARLGLRRSPLDGVPISWKDLYDSAGTATEAGSALLKDRVPDADAAVLRNAADRGLVCLGKTHLTELAFAGLGINPVTATPPNVHDSESAPGGSSSGAATSVAFGLAAAGIGSDTGGSVRVPSVWNDLVGLKTTHGYLSLEGVVPLAPSFDTVGPLARSVEDAGLLMAAMAGEAAPDLAGASLKGAKFLDLLGPTQAVAEAPVIAAHHNAVERLQAAGAEVVRGEVDAVAAALSLSPKLFAPEGYGIWHDKIEAHPFLMHEQVRERFRSGGAVAAYEFVAAWETLRDLRAAYSEAVAGYDAVLLPTCPILPPKVAPLEADPELYVRVNIRTLSNTRIANLLGLAAVTLPTGVPATGITLQGGPGSERRLLRLAAAAEKALA